MCLEGKVVSEGGRVGGMFEVGMKLRGGASTKLQDGVSTPQLPHSQSQAPLEMTDDEAIRMLELTVTRNRALEVEIRDLFRRVSCTTLFTVIGSFFIFRFFLSSHASLF